MKVLVINCGSSSLKYQLFDMAREAHLARGLVERIGERDGSRHVYESSRGRIEMPSAVPDHQSALEKMAEQLVDAEHGAMQSLDEIDAVGHRIVHGREAFVDAVEITEDVIANVEEQSPLAPLHNPPNLMGIYAARRLLGDVPHVAVFDTAFHQTMPPYAYHYAVPYEFYEKYRIRRYGFHGTSHRFVARCAAEMLGKTLAEFNGITCHLGNGCSMAAIRNGKSVDTTMGLTPLEGLVMGTRCGSLDPALPFFLARQAGIPYEEIDSLLNRQSGLLGVSGISNDVRPLEEAAERGHERAALALDIFAYSARKHIGAYMAVLNGCDMIVFTGGIGERDPFLREKICAGLDTLGVELDVERNAGVLSEQAVISLPASRVVVAVVPTNEELEIARETAEVCAVHTSH